MSYPFLKVLAIEVFCEAYLAINYNVLAFTLLLAGGF